MNEGMEKGRVVGLKEDIEQGIEQSDREIVPRMLARGFTVDDVCEATGLDAPRIEALRLTES